MNPIYTKPEFPDCTFLGSFTVRGKIFDGYSDLDCIFLKSGDRSIDHKFLELRFIALHHKEVKDLFPQFYIAYILHLMNKLRS